MLYIVADLLQAFIVVAALSSNHSERDSQFQRKILRVEIDYVLGS